MPDLVLRRGHGYRDIFRAYRIFVDGRKVGKISENSEVRIQVSAGKHSVQLKIDWCSSRELVVSVTAGLSTVLQCGPNDKESPWKTINIFGLARLTKFLICNHRLHGVIDVNPHLP
jgi:hypothetical protein